MTKILPLKFPQWLEIWEYISNVIPKDDWVKKKIRNDIGRKRKRYLEASLGKFNESIVWAWHGDNQVVIILIKQLSLKWNSNTNSRRARSVLTLEVCKIRK